MFLLSTKKGLKEGWTQRFLTRVKREKDILAPELETLKRLKELEMQMIHRLRLPALIVLLGHLSCCLATMCLRFFMFPLAQSRNLKDLKAVWQIGCCWLIPTRML